MNIYSGENGLGGALTNPTELARRKGNLVEKYEVVFRKRTYPDAETAYHALKTTSAEENDRLMVELIACKFRQHERLTQAVARRGGAAWLRTCSHLTGAKSDSAISWEGVGMNSRFIRNLAVGYELALSTEEVGVCDQFDLF